MKALEKDRTRRYETANGLAADIQRHLNNEPVTACPPSRWYEFQKSLRRHKFGFAVAAALILVLALGVSEHPDVAQTLIDLPLLHRDQNNRPEAESTVRKCLRIYIKLLGNENTGVAYALHLLAWNVYSQGRLSEAEALSRQVLAMRRNLQGNEDPNGLTALFDLAIFLHDQGKSAEAEAVVAFQFKP
jgi:tetratricopeptide (TPR) repeat protein